MKVKLFSHSLSPLAQAVTLALMGAPVAALAQANQQLDAVVVTGIRASQEKSLDVKRKAETHVEVITAEDVGKMPDKNIADSLQRVPGVTISSAGASEGGFDENDRVSMRGTNPSLTQTLINGHVVASGDWFVLNQVANAGRSVSFTMLPSELVGQVLVRKTSEASLVEGGLTGSVDIITRKPLDFKKALTAEASVGVVYADKPGKTDPQLSALFNWRDDSKTLGVLVQAFSEKRHLRRDGVEVLGYNQIKPGSKVALSNPDLSGVWYPRSIGAALFEQERKREGGLVEVQLAPSRAVSLSVTGFTSTLHANNYNRNYLTYAPFFLDEGNGTAPDAGYKVSNNTLVSAKFSDKGGNYGLYDMISRPGAKARTQFVNVEGKFKASDALSFTTKLGTSSGVGTTPYQDVMELHMGGGASWALNGTDQAPDFKVGNNASTVAGHGLDWVWGAQNVRVDDKDKWAQIDGEYALESGFFTALKFGLRQHQHDRSSADVIAQGPQCSDGKAFTWGATWCATPATSPDYAAVNMAGGVQNYPSNFGSGLGGTFPQGVWYYTQAQLESFRAFTNREPVARRYFDWEYALKEKSTAGYVQAQFQSGALSGNAGLRLVRSQQDTMLYVPALGAKAEASSAFGDYVIQRTPRSFTDVLPSINLRYSLNKDMVLRGAITRTLTRPDYAALAGATSLSPAAKPGDLGSGSAPNPELNPVRSTNFDVSWEWFHAPRALLGVSAFYMDLRSLISIGQITRPFKTFNQANPNGFMADYVLNVPVNGSGTVKGLEFTVEQPLMANFGVNANYTYTDASEEGSKPMLGASKNVMNLGAWYEDDRWNARVSYTYRSAFFNGLDRSTAFSQDAVASVSASLGYKISDNLSLTLDARNLNNPKLKYYALNREQPRSIYENGRQYYLTARMKF
ncbi:TonB-dependent receptor [Roseateles paludis]|jgi:iron complex outermembrane receptor protein|uniref:TonB-dependent receptor n=1 Tax=Roseateles paludis TaxID=3145238 RepID=A0ABV0FZU9_9BURK